MKQSIQLPLLHPVGSIVTMGSPDDQRKVEYTDEFFDRMLNTQPFRDNIIKGNEYIYLRGGYNGEDFPRYYNTYFYNEYNHEQLLRSVMSTKTDEADEYFKAAKVLSMSKHNVLLYIDTDKYNKSETFLKIFNNSRVYISIVFEFDN
jgi:hypothetical protein